MLKIYTDGACSCNGTPDAKAGIGFIILHDDVLLKEGSMPLAHYPHTNQRAEVAAAIVALNALPPNVTVTLYSDSLYLINTCLGSFGRKSNHDLWKLLDEAIAGHTITWEHIKGHSGHQWQERADQLARDGVNANNPSLLSAKFVYFKENGEFYAQAEAMIDPDHPDFAGCIAPKDFGRRLKELHNLPGIPDGSLYLAVCSFHSLFLIKDELDIIGFDGERVTP